MTATAEEPGARWHVLVQPRWLVWHAFVVLATAGMFFLGDWQLRRAESGNELSWAYTFEWPLFAAFTLYFWVKSLRDELRLDASAAGASHSAEEAQDGAGEAAGGPPSGRPRLTPADGEAYAAWLKAEVQHQSRWHRWLR
jgi:DNA-binding transcriptional regulator of glucitol operon